MVNKNRVLLEVKMEKIIKVRVNDRYTAKLIRETLINRGFARVYCKDYGNKVEFGFIQIYQ